MGKYRETYPFGQVLNNLLVKKRTGQERKIFSESGIKTTMKNIYSIIEVWIYFLIIFCPLAFGSVHVWAYTILELSTFVILLLLITKYFFSLFISRHIKIDIPMAWINLMFFLFISLIVIQMIPVPSQMIKWLSPHRFKLYETILPEKSSMLTVSICPYQTKIELLKLISYIGMFFVGLRIFDSKKKIKRAVIVIFIAGVLEAFLGLFQMLTKTNKIFWFWQSAYKKGGYFGSFVNPNHFAIYMGIVTCMGIGLLFSRPKIPFYPSDESWRHYLNRFESYISKNILIIFLITIMGASIFLSLSRGGILCLLFALILIFMLQGLRSSKKKRVVIIITSLILAFLIWIGIDPIIKELSTLIKLTKVSPQRPVAWKDSFRIIKEYPLIGVGWGNFQNIFPMYKDPMLQRSFWDHAHNEYIEYAVDTGIIGFLLFYGAVFSCFFWIIKRWIKRTENFSVGITIGGISAISLLLMANAFTFNLHIPAIAFTFFLIMALTIRSAFLYHHIPMKVVILKKKKAFFILSAIVFLLIIVIRSQMHIFEAKNLYKKYENTKQAFLLEKAVETDPDNAFYKYVLAMRYARMNRSKEALKLCISAVKLNPTNPWYHLGLAWIAYVTRESSISPKKELELALRLDPTNPVVKRYIKNWRKYGIF